MKFSLTGLSVLAACGLLTAFVGNGLPQPTVTTRDGTLITLNRYVNEPIPDIVLVGTSLTYRLKEGYFERPRVRNLALAGGSVLTGLEIVARQPRLPRIILVEANIMSRPVDNALVERYSSERRSTPRFLRPMRSVVALYENWMHAPASHAQVLSEIEKLVEEPPRNFDNHVFVERALSQLNSDDPSTAVRSTLDEIHQLLPNLEQRGARVLLFELPYAEKVAGTKSVRITHEMVHGAFPEADRWLAIDVATDSLRWADGVHLDERSAAIAVRSVEKALQMLEGPG